MDTVRDGTEGGAGAEAATCEAAHIGMNPDAIEWRRGLLEGAGEEAGSSSLVEAASRPRSCSMTCCSSSTN